MSTATSERIRLPLTNRYEFQKPIGTGGMGTVYQAFDRHTGDLVAIKVLRYKQSDNPVFHQRIIREFRAASELEHPNIVRALAFDTIDDITFLVFELVDGGSVGDHLEKRGKFPEAEAVRIITQVGQGLEYAHARGIVHRDVKPDNVLLRTDGRAKLTDFGLAKMIDSHEDNLTRPASGLGTPQFMAPEQFSDAKTVGIRSDIYSLGATLYNLVTGQLPFNGKTPLAIITQKEFERYPSPRSLVPSLSERVEAAIAAALKPDPEARPKSCLEFFKILTGRRRKGKEKGPEKNVLLDPRNRRACVRHAVGLGSSGSIDPAVQAGGELEFWPLVIRDISEGGIGILLARRFEPGTELAIEYGLTSDQPPRQLMARVIRVQPERHGHWVHGCKFNDPLTDKDLDKLVKVSNC